MGFLYLEKLFEGEIIQKFNHEFISINLGDLIASNYFQKIIIDFYLTLLNFKIINLI